MSLVVFPPGRFGQVDPGCGATAPESALATIERLGSALGPIVVWNVGYNAPSDGYAQKLDRELLNHVKHRLPLLLAC